MKIAILGPAYPYRGGISLHSNLLYKEFSKKHNIKIFNYSRLYPDILFPGKTQFEESNSFSDVSSIRSIDSINPFSWFKTARELVDFSPDLVIIQFWMPFFAPGIGSILRRIKKKIPKLKSIVLCHNIVPHEGSPIDKLLTKYLFNIADGFIIQSRSVEKDLNELIPNARYAYNPHPIYDVFGIPLKKNKAKEILGIKDDENVILYFGYIRKYKGVKYLIRSFPEILKNVNGKLLIVGEFYDDKEKYINEIEQTGVKDKIEIIDRYIPDTEVNPYFSAADIIVLPYITATQSGITQIALNYNLPCVVTNVGGLPEVVQDEETGFLVEPESSTEISEAVIKYFTHTDQKDMAKKISMEKEKFSWNVMTEKITDLYKSFGE